MILFIAPNPNKVSDKEGYLQRIAAIDTVFERDEKIYSDDLQSEQELIDAIVRADVIYVHSIYQSKRIIDLYPLMVHKIITDLHGVVPEEEELMGRETAAILTDVEKKVFQHGKYFVAVTDSMVKHFIKKYSLSNATKWVVLPIFDVAEGNRAKKLSSPTTVVYAGGTQTWQNVAKMMEAMNDGPKAYRYSILTHKPDDFNKLTQDVLSRTDLKTVSSKDIYKYYEKASMGFVLRDDSIVNRVACPTKLIEYLNYGVVPVVLSPSIGDFRQLGYKYVTLTDYLEGSISQSTLQGYVKSNYTVIGKLKRQTAMGFKSLDKIVKSIKDDHSGKLVDPSVIELVVNHILVGMRCTEVQNNLAAFIKRAEDQDTAIIEQRKEIEHLHEEIRKITNSKKWKIVNAILNPTHSMRANRSKKDGPVH